MAAGIIGSSPRGRGRGGGSRRPGPRHFLPRAGFFAGSDCSEALVRLLGFRREDRELLGDHIDRVDLLAIALEAVLLDAAPDVDQVAGLGVFRRVAANRLGEDRNLVPVRIVPRLAVLLGRVVRADRDVHLAVEFLDLADAAEDLKFCEVLHLSSPSLGRCPVCDGFP